jgi:predicted exporter
MSRPTLLAVAALATVVLLGGVFSRALTVRNDMTAFLPQGETPAAQTLIKTLQSPVLASIVLLAIEGAQTQDLARLSNDLVRRLKESNLFSSVSNGSDMLSSGDFELLFRARYLLSAKTQPGAFDEIALRSDLETDLGLLRSSAGPLVSRNLAADPTGHFLALMRDRLSHAGPAIHDGVWFSPDGRRALILARSTGSGLDTDVQSAVADTIDGSWRALDPPAGALLLATGAGVFAHQAEQQIRRETTILSVVASVAILAFLIVQLRSMSAVLVTVIPVLSGILAGAALVQSVFGFVHGVTFGFGVAMIGVAVDYPILFLGHLTPERSPFQTARLIWPTLLTGMIATACGLAPMLFSSFPGLLQLGLFAITGLVVAAAMTRLLLPRLVTPDLIVRPLIPCPTRAGLRWLRKARPLMGLPVVVGVFMLALSDARLMQDDLAELSPIPLAQRNLDETLRRDMGAPNVRHIIAVRGTSVEEALQASEDFVPILQKLVAEKAIAGYDMAAKYLPSARTQLARRDALPSPAELEGTLARAVSGLPFRAGFFAPFLQDVAAARRQDPVDVGTFARTSMSTVIDGLLYRHANEVVAYIVLMGVKAPEAIIAGVAQSHNPNLLYIDIKGEMNRLVSDYLTETLRTLGWGALAILACLAFGLRRPRAILRTLTPIVLAVITTVTVLPLIGQPLSVFHLVALMLMVGVGLDYSLFFNRSTAGEHEWPRTFRAVAMCAVTTLLSFGLLAFCSTPVMRGIGSAVAIGVACAFVFSLAFAQPSADSKNRSISS